MNLNKKYNPSPSVFTQIHKIMHFFNDILEQSGRISPEIAHYVTRPRVQKIQ